MISITESNLMTALRSFLVGVLGTGVEVIQSQNNNAAMPLGDFVTMTPMFATGLAWSRSAYVDPGVNPGIARVQRSTQWNTQLDFYGPNAANNAATVATLIRTEYACEQFAASGVDMQPLYAGEPKQTTLINAEQKYENRWTLDFIGQYNPIVQTGQDFAGSLNIGLADVDVVFPPTA